MSPKLTHKLKKLKLKIKHKKPKKATAETLSIEDKKETDKSTQSVAEKQLCTKIEEFVKKQKGKTEPDVEVLAINYPKQFIIERTITVIQIIKNQ